MFHYIKGFIVEVKDDHLVLDNNGIGYKIHVAETEYYRSFLKNQVLISVYHHVNEQEQMLFGFSTRVARDFFLLLISVSGIGPKLALKILKNQDPQNLLQSIINRDVASLLTVKGLGEKTAKRILLETAKKAEILLKENYQNWSESPQQSGTLVIKREAREALLSLGYKEVQIRKTMDEVFSQEKEIEDLEDLLKKCLKHLAYT